MWRPTIKVLWDPIIRTSHLGLHKPGVFLFSLPAQTNGQEKNKINPLLPLGRKATASCLEQKRRANSEIINSYHPSASSRPIGHPSPVMQYVRNLSDSVSTAWNSINPATLSGAIDVIVVEQDDGSLSCSPFHVRFGKFSLLRPYEKKVEFKVNGVKQPYSMKLGEGGEAFFVFETSDTIPKSLQTSPLVSPASSPPLDPLQSGQPPLQEPESLDLNDPVGKSRSASFARPPPTVLQPMGRDGTQLCLFGSRTIGQESFFANNEG